MKQEVLTDDDGTRYVMGKEVIQSVSEERTVPCKMPVVHQCGKCGFEWPDVLSRAEVKAIGKECPECRTTTP